MLDAIIVRNWGTWQVNATDQADVAHVMATITMKARVFLNQGKTAAFIKMFVNFQSRF